MATASIAQPSLLFPSVASTQRLGYVGRTPGTVSRDSDSWYTPSVYIESARQVMGSIDFDPFSSREANQIVKATYYFTPEDNAFVKPWHSARRKNRFPQGFNIWMNPPYSAGLIGDAIRIFRIAYELGAINQAIVLVNNASETKWFRLLLTMAQAVCFTDHRIAFTSTGGKHESGNTRGQVFMYIGSQNQAIHFATEFAVYGWVINRTGGWK